MFNKKTNSLRRVYFSLEHPVQYKTFLLIFAILLVLSQIISDQNINIINNLNPNPILTPVNNTNEGFPHSLNERKDLAF
jgi:hypothetical protein